ncbi:sentrin-specific protease-like [Rhopalosiphum maidis]|uniref:sentrin-specific protease-like n=1 Tax=Rhopalosiphum maidis TaxID=43146 RepID=UPI000EFF4413|nr:sentrin-specific protease-like [Rhopalosiphum maidis]
MASDRVLYNPTQLYLNDHVINNYLELINKRNSNVYIYNTHLYANLSPERYSLYYRWTKKLDLFSKTKILVPINLTTLKHWVLVCMNLELKQMQYYDSLQGNGISYQKQVFDFLSFVHLHSRGTPLNSKEWSFINVTNIPIQKNSYDCGVFLCTYAEYLARDAVFNFSQEHMVSFRQLIAYELTTKKLVDINVEAHDIDAFITSIVNA